MEIQQCIKARNVTNLKLGTSRFSDNKYLESIKESDKFIINKLNRLEKKFNELKEEYVEIDGKFAVNPLQSGKYQNTYKTRKQQFENNLKIAKIQQVQDEKQQVQDEIKKSKEMLQLLVEKEINMVHLTEKFATLNIEQISLQEIANINTETGKIKSMMEMETDKLKNLEMKLEDLSKQPKTNYDLSESFSERYVSKNTDGKKWEEREEEREINRQLESTTSMSGIGNGSF